MYYSLYNINLIWTTEEPGCIGGHVPFGIETGAIVYYFDKFHEYQIIKKFKWHIAFFGICLLAYLLSIYFLVSFTRKSDG